MHVMYRMIRPVLFFFDSERVHNSAIAFGERIGNKQRLRHIIAKLLDHSFDSLRQNISGITFSSPIGLAAGFDYEARLTRIISALGFGFSTVGTLTYHPYEGNPRPMLGRLPKSRALVVNKGFKNLGVQETLRRLSGEKFSIPIGISIGKTNTDTIKTQEEAVADVVAGFQDAELSGVQFAYYELNISCPNLKGNIEFYLPAHLEELLKAVGKLSISRPVFVKMPIIKTNDEIRSMLSVCERYGFVTGVIFGNLQKDRTHPCVVSKESERYPKGNLSGLPCRDRSDELISLAYTEYGKRFVVVGCGGIFTAEDAYRKVKLGASLLQLITGLIYEGPQRVAEINLELARYLTRDGFKSISDAVGSAHR